MPLLLSHGWPGSVFEFLELIPRLTDPARFGGDPRDAFTVVAPSLPGYALSFRPNQPRFGIAAMIASACRPDARRARLRALRRAGRRLGRVHRVAGSAMRIRDTMIGIHLNLLSAAARSADAVRTRPPRRSAISTQLAHWLEEETGYSGSRAPGRRRSPSG